MKKVLLLIVGLLMPYIVFADVDVPGNGYNNYQFEEILPYAVITVVILAILIMVIIKLINKKKAKTKKK